MWENNSIGSCISCSDIVFHAVENGAATIELNLQYIMGKLNKKKYTTKYIKWMIKIILQFSYLVSESGDSINKWEKRNKDFLLRKGHSVLLWLISFQFKAIIIILFLVSLSLSLSLYEYTVLSPIAAFSSTSVVNNFDVILFCFIFPFQGILLIYNFIFASACFVFIETSEAYDLIAKNFHWLHHHVWLLSMDKP